MSFSLYDFARDIQRRNDTIDPDTLAKEVGSALEESPPADQAAALEQALRSYVQHVLANVRRRPSVFPGGHAPFDAHGTSAAGDSNQRDSSRSWKTRGSRQYWHPKLEDPYWAGTATDWLRFGDLGVAALNLNAEYHAKLAAANHAKAVELHEWAELLVEHNVAVIRDLPASVLRQRLGGEKAA